MATLAKNTPSNTSKAYERVVSCLFTVHTNRNGGFSGCDMMNPFIGEELFIHQPSTLHFSQSLVVKVRLLDLVLSSL